VVLSFVKADADSHKRSGKEKNKADHDCLQHNIEHDPQQAKTRIFGLAKFCPWSPLSFLLVMTVDIEDTLSLIHQC
jgi:hypothetical protein